MVLWARSNIRVPLRMVRLTGNVRERRIDRTLRGWRLGQP
jgi:hypothetical protein